MKAVGLQTAIWNNNLRSMALLILFPILVFTVLMAIGFVGSWFFGWHTFLLDGDVAKIDQSYDFIERGLPPGFDQLVLRLAALVTGIILIWYLIAYLFHQRLIDHFANAQPITRREYPKIYNALENLCISRGLPMPKLGLIDSGKMNAFASGLSQKTYRITLTRGLMEALDDEELEAVLAHELTHIINRDVRLMVIAAIFTGILALMAEGFSRGVLRGATHRSMRYGGRAASRRGGGGQFAIGVILIMVIVWLGYVMSLALRSLISRKREFMADAGAVQLTKKPEPMIRALRKISARSHMPDFDDELRIMLFDNSKRFLGLFDTHPPIDKRVATIQAQTRTDFDYIPARRSRRHRELDSGHPNPWRIREMGMGTKVGRRKRKER